MAINKEAFFATKTKGPMLRFGSRYQRTIKLAAVGAAPIYAPGTPVAFDTSTSTWKIWASGGANGTGTIRAFIWPNPVQTHATDEVIAVALFRGVVHRDDVVLPAGQTQNNLDIALAVPGMRSQGIDIDGLAGIN